MRRVRGAAVLALGVLWASACSKSPAGSGAPAADAGDDGAATTGGSGGSGGGLGAGSGSSSGSASSSGSGGGSTSSGGHGMSSSGSGGTSGGSSGGAQGSSSSSGSGGSCPVASILGALGRDHLLVGGSMAASTASSAPFDAQYDYISGGIAPGSGPCTSCQSNCSSSWWGCWQDPSQPPGQYVSGFVASCQGETPAQLPMISYYQLLQSSGVGEGAPEVTQAATDASFMSRYFADWRFLLQQIGENVALLHVEPDFWGYAEQQNEDPTALPAAVASANGTDCASLPNTIAGMGKCMIAMVRTYAPHALVALHASAWGTDMNVLGNTDPSFDVAAQAQQTAAFLAACGESSADFVVVETSDRDAGYYACQGESAWWDATNATLPDFHQAFAWTTALTTALGKPALYWQTPLGNGDMPSGCPASGQTQTTWQDNRVAYFFGHMNELAAANAFGAVFGAGASGQTTPETDGGYFLSQAKAYYAAGGQAACP